MLTSHELAFFAKKEAERSLYHQLIQQMRDVLPLFELHVQKTQIAFLNPGVFACVSLRQKNSIVISLGLPDRIASPRVVQAVEVRPGRWTNHILLHTTDEIDEELLGWIGAAYAFAAMKKKSGNV